MSWVSNAAGIRIYTLIKAGNIVQKRMTSSNLGFHIVFILLPRLRVSERGTQSQCHPVQRELDWHFSRRGLAQQTAH